MDPHPKREQSWGSEASGRSKAFALRPELIIFSALFYFCKHITVAF